MRPKAVPRRRCARAATRKLSVPPRGGDRAIIGIRFTWAAWDGHSGPKPPGALTVAPRMTVHGAGPGAQLASQAQARRGHACGGTWPSPNLGGPRIDAVCRLAGAHNPAPCFGTRRGVPRAAGRTPMGAHAVRSTPGRGPAGNRQPARVCWCRPKAGTERESPGQGMRAPELGRRLPRHPASLGASDQATTGAPSRLSRRASGKYEQACLLVGWPACLSAGPGGGPPPMVCRHAHRNGALLTNHPVRLPTRAPCLPLVALLSSDRHILAAILVVHGF